MYDARDVRTSSKGGCIKVEHKVNDARQHLVYRRGLPRE